MESPKRQMPKIFHVNWFRKGNGGKFLWPGFGENSRVIDWIFRRLEGEDCAQESPIGLIPKEDALNLKGLKEEVDIKQLFSLPKDFWMQEVSDIRILCLRCKYGFFQVSEIEKYLSEQVGKDLPIEVEEELRALRKRVDNM